MLFEWTVDLGNSLETFNQILTAGISITAFSLFIYSLSFNLRDRVARSFALILVCVVIVFTSEAIQSAVQSENVIDIFLRLEWVGIALLPAAYLHLSDAVLVTAGRPSRGRRRIAVRLMYLVAIGFIGLLVGGRLVGGLVMNGQPAPHLSRTIWTEVFTLYYLFIMSWAWINFSRAYQRMLTRSGRRRMLYLMAGATAPALGSYPYLLYGSPVAAGHPLFFWGLSTVINVAVGGLMVVMAYAVAFFGVSWPDRVVKSRLVKWIMRGPVAASVTLAVVTLVRRAGEAFGLTYSAAVPVVMVACILLIEHGITLVAPLWERWLFFGPDRARLEMLQSMEERLLTQSDLRQFLEAVLAAVRDHMQSSSAFVAALDGDGLELLVTAGRPLPEKEDISAILQVIDGHEAPRREYAWQGYWILPLSQRPLADMDLDAVPPLIGLMGVQWQPATQNLESDQRQALWLLADRAALALEDRRLQQNFFRSMENLQPEMDLLQRMRAVGRYDTAVTMLSEDFAPETGMATWVRDALSHYWGGPKLTQSPLTQLKVVQDMSRSYEGNLPNALRALLRQAVDQVRPEGERRFTSEWILYNILEMKFIEGRKVREVAAKLAMSEADLYRKQRVAIEAVARSIAEMEQELSSQREGGAPN